MKLNHKIYLIFIVTASTGCQINERSNMKAFKYKDNSLSIEERVYDLLSHMTIEEKAAQMVAVNNDVKNLIALKPDGSFDISAIKMTLSKGVGQITRLSETRGGLSQTSATESAPLTPYENAVLSNTIQKYFIEETRLGIPAIFHEESLHGLAAAYATCFPQPIAMAGSFNPKLIEQVYTLMAKETRLRGAHQVLSPVVDIARDARWGRVEETFGEDTYLTTIMGGAAVKGFQGDNAFTDGEHVAATLKHFAGHGQPEGGNNTAPVNISERVLREYHLAPFKNIIKKQGALSVMTTYHEIDGVPAHGNKWLNTDILRKEWGFKGFVVADYYAIREMHERNGIVAHGVARDGYHAAELAIKAGVNIELPEPDCYKHIVELVNMGIIPMERIDELVGEMLTVKFKLGLFDNPYVDPQKAKDFCGIEAHRELALEAALQSITLLENKKGIVPLKLDKKKKIAVIGPNANRVLLGGYSGIPNYKTPLYESIREYAGNNAEVVFAQGCGITVGGSWVEDEVVFSDPIQDDIWIKEAAKVAADANVIILAVGGNEQTSREAWSLSHLGDRTNLDLIGAQNKLINALHMLDKPMVAFVFNGRPLAFNNLIEKADAIFECWYLGQESGNAAAKVLFGEYNPGGKLPISFPRSVGHLPVYYNHKPTARRGYLNDDVSPLYPFGYGLSYTKFEISQIALVDSVINKNDSFTVTLTITNIGKVEGAEVVQVYIRDVQSSVTRPVKELKAFKRVNLKPGETKKHEFVMNSEALAFYDINMDWVVEPGRFNIMVGNSSADNDLETVTLTVK
jgi:beta-glucosidase